MALSHNVFIRGLNSIYLQAPHIRPEDHADFIAYCKCWCEILNSHHQMEEATVFPKIEEITGEKGIMDVNVEQHRTSSLSLDYDLWQRPLEEGETLNLWITFIYSLGGFRFR
jgi:hemerythrin-like domain-containing protein